MQAMFAAGAVALFVPFALALVYSDAALGRVNALAYYGRVREAVAWYQRVSRWSPPGLRADLFYSRAIAASARKVSDPKDALLAWQEGLVAAERATQSAEDRENAWLNLAVFYGRQNDYPHTELALREAIACSPNSYKPHWLLAQVLWTGNKLPEAAREAEKATELDGGNDPGIAATLAHIRAAVTNSRP